MHENNFIVFGVIVLVATGLGHLFFVDFSMTFLLGEFVRVIPSQSVLKEIQLTTVDWGVFGNTRLSSAIRGFSLWLTISLCIFSVTPWIVFRHTDRGHVLRQRVCQIGIAFMSCFLTIAACFFITPPIVGGAIGVIVFSLALRDELRFSAEVKRSI